VTLESLPGLNACFNAASAALLVLGFVMIRRRRVAAHVACMAGALVSSSLFLAGYLTYHAHHGSTPFRGTGPVRIVYFAILISHTILAAAVLPLVLVTLARALRRDFARHRRMARVTLPVWLYVSATGVVVYWMLYRLGF
jgi:uncharacterized membrane protein YozB (DUF420 family)